MAGTLTIAERSDRAAPAAAAAKLPRLDGLNGLRGVAVLAVLFFHAEFSWAAGGFLGVSLFFTLSGFLITSRLLEEHARRGTVNLWRFWAGRIRRLVPASLAAMVLAVVFTVVAGTGDQLAAIAGDIHAALAWMANWRFILTGAAYGAAAAEPSAVQHFWSLAVEEQFYVVFPLIVVGVLRATRGSRSALGVAVAALTAGSLAVTLTSWTPGQDTTTVYFSTFTRAAELLAGAFLAVVFAARRRTTSELVGPAARRWVTAAGFAALAGSVALWATTTETDAWLFEGGLAAYAALSAVVIVAAVAAPGGLFGRALAVRPLVWLGEISYGVYLYHWPVFLWLSPDRTGLDPGPLCVVRLAVTLALAATSLRWLEGPIRDAGKRPAGPADRQWLMVAAAPAVIAAVAVGVIAAVAVVPDRVGVAEILAASPQAQDPSDIVPVDPGPSGPSTTVAAEHPAPERVLLVGDSVAGQALDQFRDTFAAAGIAVGYAGGPGSGPLQPQGSWAVQIDRWVTEWDPEVVVLEACCDYSQPTRQLYVDADGNQVEPNTPEAYAAWNTETRDLTRRAAAGGASVIWVLSPPTNTNGFYGPLETHVAVTNAIYRRIAGDTAGVSLIDWGESVAPGGEFTWDLPDAGGTATPVRLSDGLHLTDFGSQLIADQTLAAVLDPSTVGGRSARPANDPPERTST